MKEPGAAWSPSATQTTAYVDSPESYDPGSVCGVTAHVYTLPFVCKNQSALLITQRQRSAVANQKQPLMRQNMAAALQSQPTVSEERKQ